MDVCGELILLWLNFVKGVVDSEDLPLITSRETLQQYQILRAILMNFAKKCLEMLAGITEKNDDFKKFYEQHGQCSKLGLHEDSTNRTKFGELLRVNTSKSGDEQTCLKDYVDRVVQGQNDTHFLAGESTVVSPSLFHGQLRMKGHEVLVVKKHIKWLSTKAQGSVFFLPSREAAAKGGDGYRRRGLALGKIKSASKAWHNPSAFFAMVEDDFRVVVSAVAFSAWHAVLVLFRRWVYWRPCRHGLSRVCRSP